MSSVTWPRFRQHLRRPPCRTSQPAAAERLEDRALLTAYVVDTLDDVSGFDDKVSLREAIEAANTNAASFEAEAGQASVADFIAFSPALSGGTIRLAGTQLTVNGGLNIVGLGASRLAVSGEDACRIFEVSVGQTADIRGLTLTRGKALNSAGAIVNGGGVLNGGVLTLADCVVSDSEGNFGGGVSNAGTLWASAITVSGNRAINFGGAIMNRGGGSLTITASILSGNAAANSAGGLYNESGSATTVAGSMISGNQAGPIGLSHGIFGGGISNDGTMVVTGSMVDGNRASASGGGIYNGGTLVVSGSTLSGNEAAIDGGGIRNDATLTLVNVTVSANAAAVNGGGLNSQAGTASLRNVTIFGNRADSDGAGGGSGGGVFRNTVGPSTVTLHNTLVAGNIRGFGTGTPDDSGGAPLAAGSSFNLISDVATAGGLAEGGPNFNIVGANVAALLDPVLRDNGGPTLTHKLLVGSRAINAGSNNEALRPDGGKLVTDQRGAGFKRVLNGRADIGAFEAAPAADLVGFLNGGWWVGASTGTSFNTTLWAGWSNAAWDALGQADFDKDGKADVFGLLDGAWWVGRSTGIAYETSLWGRWSNLDWQDAKTGDLNADGRADVLARAGGNWWAALSNGTGFDAPTLWTSWAVLPWREFFLTNLTGDGRADLVGYQRGQWWASLSTGTTFTAPKLIATWSDAAWQKLLILDADGDGKQDVAGLLAGSWWVGQSRGLGSTPVLTTTRWAAWSNVAWSDPLVGDFDGDGKDDVAARNGGSWWVGLSEWARFNGPTLWAGWSIAAWQDVRVGDFDGDGRDDLAGRMNGQWWIGRSTSAAFTTSLWGTWSNVAWRAVGAVDATGHVVGVGAGIGGAFAASQSVSQNSAFALRVTDDEPLRLFWSTSDKDEEFVGRLAVV